MASSEEESLEEHWSAYRKANVAYPNVKSQKAATAFTTAFRRQTDSHISTLAYAPHGETMVIGCEDGKLMAIRLLLCSWLGRTNHFCLPCYQDRRQRRRTRRRRRKNTDHIMLPFVHTWGIAFWSWKQAAHWNPEMVPTCLSLNKQ